MIARARPYLAHLDSGVDLSPSLLLFNSGRAALKFLLHELKLRRGEPQRVGVQAFTCSVVLDAILESGNVPVLFDIDFRYLSAGASQIPFESLDVLMLTHLFGIRHPEANRCLELAQRFQVFVIEDCAQYVTDQGLTEDCRSDAQLFSFGFDKPISTFMGGGLKLKEVESFLGAYSELPVDNDRNDLSRLKLYHKLTGESLYSPRLKMGSPLEGLLMLIPSLHPLFVSRLGARIQWVLSSGVQKPIKISRMGDEKRAYLQSAFSEYPENLAKRRINLDRLVRHLKGEISQIQFPLNMEFCSTRLPAFVEDRAKISKLWQEKGVEVGPYNWGRLCFHRCPELGYKKEDFPQAVKAASSILNFPIWSESNWWNS